MVRFLRPSRPTSESGFAYRLGWWLGRLIVWFLVVSVGLTVVYRFVPVPVTITMLADPHGFTKDWTGLSRIDRNMVAAVIAGEDSKFCQHEGFDREAIERAMERNARSTRIRGGSTISQQTAKNVFDCLRCAASTAVPRPLEDGSSLRTSCQGVFALRR